MCEASYCLVESRNLIETEARNVEFVGYDL